jgi:glycosyltransferase involved in cell wall biosynthesis
MDRRERLKALGLDRVLILDRGNVLLFLGRIGASKGCDTLLDSFQEYVAAGGTEFDLVLGGTLELELPVSERIRHVGVVHGRDKADALAGAAVIACPSPWDCLSMVACEGWSAGRPILVTAKSPIVSSLCRRANGGATYADSNDFTAQLRRLAGDPEWANACGRNGQAFVQQHYSWDVVLPKFRALLERTMP